MIENLSKEENNLQSLEEKRDMLKKLYNEIVARCESMEKVLKLATGSKDTLPEVLKKLIKDLEEMRSEEKQSKAEKI